MTNKRPPDFRKPAGGHKKTGPERPERSERKVRLSTATMVALAGVGSYGAVKAIAATAVDLPIIAKLVRAIEITVNTTLDFGTLAMTVDRAGFATIDPALNRLLIDNASSLTLAGGKPSAGRLTLRGAEFPVAVTIEDPTVKMTNGTNTVMVTGFNMMTAKGGTQMTFTPTQKTFALTIPVGATIQTKVGQLSGTYVGTTRISASYQ